MKDSQRKAMFAKANKKATKEFGKGNFKLIERKRYQIYIIDEGSTRPRPIPEYFDSLIEATTFANIEAAAGMGESYVIKDRGTNTFIN